MRRRPLLAAGASALAAVTLAGCLDGTGSDSTTDGTDEPSVTPPNDTDASPSTASTTEPSTGALTTEITDGRRIHDPEPNLEVGVANNYDEAEHRVRVTVRDRRRNICTYTWTSTLEPGYDDPTYDVEDADSTAVQSYEIRIAFAVKHEDRAASTVLWTNQCHGDVTLTVTANGALEAAVDNC